MMIGLESRILILIGLNSPVHKCSLNHLGHEGGYHKEKKNSDQLMTGVFLLLLEQLNMKIDQSFVLSDFGHVQSADALGRW
jgi:hypothetical protein